MRLPDDSQRLMGVGKTGSGKTIAGLWHLSQRSYNKIPWTIIDFKNDKSIAQIPYLIEISPTDLPPTEPGLYVMRPAPDDAEDVDAYFMNVWAQENHGIFVDEGYMIGGGSGKSAAFQTLLTQGRSKNIPMITLSQRPAWLSRFAFSEADFFQVFWLNDAEDRKRVVQFLPGKAVKYLPIKVKEEDGARMLEKYHSVYYDVGDDELSLLKPVPKLDSILATFERRLAPVVSAPPEKPRKIAI